MSLSDNPIFLTQKRLVHRGGVLAAVLIASLVGICLLAGLIEHLANPPVFDSLTIEEAAKLFYGWIVGIEAVILILVGAFRVARSLGEDRKAGLWDSNRLTPLRPWQLIIGYWFGAPLREFYMAVVLALCGLVVVLLGKLPITLWLGSQVLILTTACLLGLLCLLMVLAFERQQGLLGLVLLFFVYPFSFIVPGRMLPNFLMPIYSLVYLFRVDDRDWNVMPQIFGMPIHPVLLAVGLQFFVGIFLWRAAVRKTVRPAQPLLLRWEALAFFTIVVAIQHGLIWNIWSGVYPTNPVTYSWRSEDVPLLSFVCGMTIFMGILILASASLLPEAVRVDSLRLGFKNVGAIFPRGAVSLGLVLAAVAGAGILTQCMFALGDSWEIVAVAVINLVELFVSFALLLEYCRVRHKRRAGGFLVLWLFVLWVLPFILAGVLLNKEFVKVSLLSPAFFAICDPKAGWSSLFLTELGHFGIVVVLFFVWWRQWKRLLVKAAAA